MGFEYGLQERSDDMWDSLYGDLSSEEKKEVLEELDNV